MACFGILSDHPGDPYAVAMTGRAFEAISGAQKQHVLGKYLPLPSPYFPESYDTLLQFLQNLRLDEVGLINYHFLLPFQASLSNYPPFAEAWTEERAYSGK